MLVCAAVIRRRTWLAAGCQLVARFLFMWENVERVTQEANLKLQWLL